MSDQSSEAMRQRFVASVVLRHGLALVMTLCLGMALLDAGQRLIPALPAGLLLAFCLIVSAEAMYATHVLAHRSSYGRGTLGYRITEWVLIGVGLKAALYAVRGFDRLPADLAAWQADFTTFFMDGEFLFGVVVLVLVWIVSTLLAVDLAEVDADPRQLEADRVVGIRTNRLSSRQKLSDHILIVGGAIVLLAILAHLQWSGGIATPPRVEPIGFYAMLYLVAALGLLGLTQFTLLRAGWLWDRLPVSQTLGQRWLLFGGLFLLTLTALALILPTGYSVGLLGVLSYMIGLVVTAIQFIVYLVMQILYLIFVVIASLLGTEAPKEAPQPPAPPVMTPAPSAPTSEPLPWLEIVKSLVFWAIFLGVILYSLGQFLQLRKDWLAKLRELPALAILLKGWTWLLAQLRSINRAAVERLAAAIRQWRPARPAAAAAPANRFLNLRRLSPRQQILYFYLALLQRSAQRGLGRKPAQTPNEYAGKLEAALPDADADVKAMTAEFMEARYSAHEVPAEKAGAMRTYWERVKAAMRQLGRAPASRSEGTRK